REGAQAWRHRDVRADGDDGCGLALDHCRSDRCDPWPLERHRAIMTAPLVTALYAAMIGLLAVILTVNVIRNRVILKIDDGDGGNATMRMAIRAHANFAQHAPLALLLIGIAEAIGTGKTVT